MCYAYPLSYAFHKIHLTNQYSCSLAMQETQDFKKMNWYYTAINITPLIGFIIIFNFWNYIKCCVSSPSNKAAYRYLFLLTVLMWSGVWHGVLFWKTTGLSVPFLCWTSVWLNLPCVDWRAAGAWWTRKNCLQWPQVVLRPMLQLERRADTSARILRTRGK